MAGVHGLNLGSRADRIDLTSPQSRSERALMEWERDLANRELLTGTGLARDVEDDGGGSSRIGRAVRTELNRSGFRSNMRDAGAPEWVANAFGKPPKDAATAIALLRNDPSWGDPKVNGKLRWESGPRIGVYLSREMPTLFSGAEGKLTANVRQREDGYSAAIGIRYAW